MNTTDTVDRLEQEVSTTRSSLHDNVDELKSRARHLTDWRAQVDEHPMAMMGIALGGGLLAASMIGGRARNGSEVHGRAARRKYSGRHDRRNHVLRDRRGPQFANGHAHSPKSTAEDSGSGWWRGLGTVAATAAPLVKRMKAKRSH